VSRNASCCDVACHPRRTPHCAAAVLPGLSHFRIHPRRTPQCAAAAFPGLSRCRRRVQARCSRRRASSRPTSCWRPPPRCCPSASPRPRRPHGSRRRSRPLRRTCPPQSQSDAVRAHEARGLVLRAAENAELGVMHVRTCVRSLHSDAASQCLTEKTFCSSTVQGNVSFSVDAGCVLTGRQVANSCILARSLARCDNALNAWVPSMRMCTCAVEADRAMVVAGHLLATRRPCPFPRQT